MSRNFGLVNDESCHARAGTSTALVCVATFRPVLCSSHLHGHRVDLVVRVAGLGMNALNSLGRGRLGQTVDDASFGVSPRLLEVDAFLILNGEVAL